MRKPYFAILFFYFIYFLSCNNSEEFKNSCDPKSNFFITYLTLKFAINDKSSFCNINLEPNKEIHNNQNNPVTSPVITPPYSEIKLFTNNNSELANNANLSFGNIISGGILDSKKDLILTLKNNGNSNLVISSITVTGTDFSLLNTPLTTISAGQSSNFTIRFDPSSISSFSGTLNISSNSNSNTTFVLNLSGNGINFASLANLTIYYNFKLNTNDQSGNARHGTIVGAITYSNDRFNSSSNAAHGNGNNSNYITMTNPPVMSGLNSFTILFWASWSQNGVNFFERRNIAGAFEIVMYVDSSGKVNFNFGQGGICWGAGSDWNSITSPSLNTFHHIALVKNGTSAQLYINGTLAQNITNINSNCPTLSTAINSTGAFNIFAPIGFATSPFIGSMDNFMIYNTALSSSDIQLLYLQDQE